MKASTGIGEAGKGSPLSSNAVGRVLAAAAVVVAIAIVALIATPSGVWRHPANDGVYKGFDPNLMYVSPKGPSTNPGDVVVSPDSLTIAAAAGSQPTVHLVTTPLSFSAAFDVTVMADTPDSVPLRIALWSPEASAGYYLVFDPAGNVIRTETVVGGESLQDLVGGTVKPGKTLGTFNLAQTYHVVADVDHVNPQKMSFTVDSSGSDVLLPEQAPEIVNAFRPTLTLSASAVEGSSQAVIRNYVVTIPSQPSSSAEETVKVDDPLARLLVLLLLAASLALCLFVVVRWLVARWGGARVMPALWVRVRARVVLLLLGVAAIYLLANLSLFGVASPHFDVLAAKVWSYVAFKYGFGDLYYRTILVPAAGAWQGVPVHEATFPYGITKAYFYLVAGWVYHLLPGSATINTFSFEVLLKAMNVLFGLADGILVYLIVKRLTSERTALTAAILFVANPALVLVMSVWGSTETVSLFFILGSIWLAEEQRPLGAWLMLALGAFTRPQMFVFAFLLGLIYLYKFGARRNVSALAWTVILCFVAIGPFALAISPSLPVDYVVRTFIYHVGNGQADVAYLGISPANFSIWTIPLLLVSGQHGLNRMWAPSTLPLAGSLTYGQLAAGMSIAFLLIVGAVLLMNRKVSLEPGRYLPLVAFAMLGWLIVTPGLISRYMVYVVVAVILCRKAFSTAGYIYAVSVTTAITCMSIYGHLALDFLGYSGSANVLSPTNNAVSQFLFSVFSADWFISLASLSNVALLIVLGVKGWESLRKERPPALAAAAAGAE